MQKDGKVLNKADKNRMDEETNEERFKYQLFDSEKGNRINTKMFVSHFVRLSRGSASMQQGHSRL